MEKEIPRTWILIKVVDISDIVRGITYQKSDASTTKFANSCLVLRGGNIQDGKILIDDDCVYVADSLIKKDQKLREGDVIIVGSTGSAKLIGKAAFSLVDEEEISFGAFLVMLRPDKKIESRYFDYFFLTDFYRKAIRELAGGININNIRREHLEGIDFPLPPHPEQQRIVAKLDTLFGQLDRIKTSIERIPQMLKDFRQKVLTQAVTGKLVKKSTKWDETNLGNLVFKGGIFDGPFGSNLKTEDYTNSGVRVIRLENIEHLRFIKDKETFISKEKYDSLIRHTVVEGDIIFSSFISEDIRACILPELWSTAIAKADCFCIRPDETRVNKKFLLFALVSTNTFNQLVSKIHGATRPRINTTQLKSLPIALPKIPEQQEIVCRVESLFAKADQIEASYQKLKVKLEQLPQALLAKAFKGELVEQLPTDGDARDLLEQIKKAKAGLGKGGKSKRLGKEEPLRMVAEDGARYGKRR